MTPRLPRAVVRRLVASSSMLVVRPGIPLEAQRRRYDAFARLVLPPVPATVVRRELGGVRCDVVTARGADPARVVVHLHGGGFCIGSPRSHRGFAGALSAAADASVVLPDYRLAPEHPFPAAVEDTLAVWDAVEQPARRALSGDSAGGNLALSAALRLRDAGAPMPQRLVLLSPGLDLAADRTAYPALVRGDVMLRPGWLARCHTWYAGGRPLDDPALSPLRADLTGLPPTLVVAATDELLLPDADRFSTAARAAGVEVTDIRADGMWHIYPTQAGMVAEADSAVRRIGAFLRDDAPVSSAAGRPS